MKEVMNKNAFRKRLKKNFEETAGIRFTHVETRQVLDIFLATLEEAIEMGGVKFQNSFSMEKTATKARKGRNPRTGERIDVPAGTRVRFSPMPKFARRLNPGDGDAS